jgi:hypothetical protein
MSSSSKKIQIDMGMFLDVFRLITALEQYDLDFSTQDLCKRLEGQIYAKLEAIEKRNVYTQSKVALTEDEKEQARQKYLDLAGIHKDFRYGKDFGKDNPV